MLTFIRSINSCTGVLWVSAICSQLFDCSNIISTSYRTLCIPNINNIRTTIHNILLYSIIVLCSMCDVRHHSNKSHNVTRINWVLNPCYITRGTSQDPRSVRDNLQTDWNRLVGGWSVYLQHGPLPSSGTFCYECQAQVTGLVLALIRVRLLLICYKLPLFSPEDFTRFTSL